MAKPNIRTVHQWQCMWRCKCNDSDNSYIEALLTSLNFCCTNCSRTLILWSLRVTLRSKLSCALRDVIRAYTNDTTGTTQPVSSNVGQRTFLPVHQIYVVRIANESTNGKSARIFRAATYDEYLKCPPSPVPSQTPHPGHLPSWLTLTLNC